MISGAGSFIADKIINTPQGDGKATQCAKTQGDVIAPSAIKEREAFTDGPTSLTPYAQWISEVGASLVLG